MQMAKATLDRVESTIDKAMGPLLTAMPAELAAKVYDVIQRAGTVAHSQLVKYCWRMGDAGQITMALDTLIQANMIELVINGARGGRAYRVVSSKIEITNEEGA
jgi:hypothetical protein